VTASCGSAAGGPKQTGHVLPNPRLSVLEGKADMRRRPPECRLMTHSGRRRFGQYLPASPSVISPASSSTRGHASLLRPVVRIHLLAADEVGHGGNDAIRLLDDHEMPGVRDIDDLHALAQLIP